MREHAEGRVDDNGLRRGNNGTLLTMRQCVMMMMGKEKRDVRRRPRATRRAHEAQQSTLCIVSQWMMKMMGGLALLKISVVKNHLCKRTNKQNNQTQNKVRQHKFRGGGTRGVRAPLHAHCARARQMWGGGGQKKPQINRGLLGFLFAGQGEQKFIRRALRRSFS